MDLFLYGTLRSDALRRAVAGCDLSGVPAVLDGWACEGVAGEVVPLIRAVPGARAPGLLLRDVPETALARLDVYELPWGYDRRALRVEGPDGPVEAGVYLPPADYATTAAPWDLDGWQRTHEAASVLAAEELFARDPRPPADELRRMWPMMGRRAWSRLRRQADVSPATLRHDPAPGDWELAADGPPAGRFFALQPLTIRHRRFDGTDSGALSREVFVGIEAALVLPYDPVSDRVLLVEQIRVGAAALGDPNPWMLEPVAGMLDAGETPEAAALRETQEETGISAVTLHHIQSFYPSPGSSTDFFHAYLGLCHLPDGQVWQGGLDAESEDLRLHPVAFERAMALLSAGELRAGPLQMMLYWLALQRDRLRAGVA